MSQFAWLSTTGLRSLRISGTAIAYVGPLRWASNQSIGLGAATKQTDSYKTEMKDSILESQKKSFAPEVRDPEKIEKRSKGKPYVMADKLYKTIELEMLAYHGSVLDSYQWFVLTAAKHLNLEVGKVWAPFRPDHFRFSLNRSAHVHKKAQVQYEVRTYHRFINLHRLTGSTADTFLEYIERNVPEGVGLKVTKYEVLPLPDFVKETV